MSGQVYKRHIPQGNSPDEMRMSHTKLWDAIDSLSRQIGNNAAQVGPQIQQAISSAPASVQPLPPPPLAQVGVFGDIFLLMGG